MDKKQLIEEIETLEIDVDELEDASPSAPLAAAKFKVQCERLRLVAAAARSLLKSPKLDNTAIGIVGLSIILAEGLSEALAEINRLKKKGKRE